jgi:hypothetical protein
VHRAECGTEGHSTGKGGLFIAEGLDIDRTRNALGQVWKSELGAADPLVTMREHFEQHGLAKQAELEGAKPTGARILEMTARCRTCVLGRALLIVHRFATRDHGLIVHAKALREAWEGWKRFREKFAVVDNAPVYTLLDVFDETERHLEMYSYQLEKVPKAMLALSGTGAGRKAASLRRELSVILDNGGLTLREMAGLVHEDVAKAGREKRLRNDLEAAGRRRKTATRRKAGARSKR